MPTDYAALLKMFGKPNLNCKVGNIQPDNSFSGTTHFQEIECSWESQNVLLKLLGTRGYKAKFFITEDGSYKQKKLNEFKDATYTSYNVIFQKRDLVYLYNQTIKSFEDDYKKKVEDDLIKGF